MSSITAGEEQVSIKKQFFRWKTLFSFLLSFFIFYLVIRKIDLAATWKTVKQVNILYLLAALVFYYLSFPVRAIRWQRLLANVGTKQKFGDVLEILFLSWFANCIVPAKLGDIYRGYLLKKNYNVSLMQTMGTIFVERLIDLAVLFILFGITGFLGFKGHLPPIVMFYLKVGFAVIAVIVVVLGIVKYYGKSTIEKFLPKKLLEVYSLFMDGTFASLKGMSFIFLLTVFVWLFESVRLLFIVKAFGLSLNVAIVIFVALAASVLTVIPLTPAGLGFVEVAQVGALGFLHISKNYALGITMLDRFVSYWSIIIIGFVLYLLSKKTGETASNSPTEQEARV